MKCFPRKFPPWIMRINVLRNGSQLHQLNWDWLGFQWRTCKFVFNFHLIGRAIVWLHSSRLVHHLVFCTRWLPKCLCNQTLICCATVKKRDSCLTWILNAIYINACKQETRGCVCCFSFRGTILTRHFNVICDACTQQNTWAQLT